MRAKQLRELIQKADVIIESPLYFSITEKGQHWSWLISKKENRKIGRVDLDGLHTRCRGCKAIHTIPLHTVNSLQAGDNVLCIDGQVSIARAGERLPGQKVICLWHVLS